MRKCVPACVCTYVCVGVAFERENIVCGCCIFDELALHNGPVEGCCGSFQAGITRQVSASTFKAASYNNFSKKYFYRLLKQYLDNKLLQAVVVSLGPPPGASWGQSASEWNSTKNATPINHFYAWETSTSRTSCSTCCSWDGTKNLNQVSFSKLFNVYIQWIVSQNKLLPSFIHLLQRGFFLMPFRHTSGETAEGMSDIDTFELVI